MSDDPRVAPLVALCLSKPHIRGLWLHGPRQSGTTTLARSVGLALPDEMVPASATVTGAKLASTVREVWRLDGLVRHAFGDDLLSDLYRTEKWLEDTWSVPVLFINDVTNIDAEFWSKHILHSLDERMKAQQVSQEGFTLVAGNTSPRRFPSEWADGIEGLFHVVDIGDLARGAR